ncbi:HNH endonuclease signature motif containing protein [Actinacidiphila glaucinigra]|uniref:HNH endonuclease signature motif containing protein n=1 Tax=Actinacidiphila glaucinigra TaxID=235986 RepID=UPI00378BC83A
MPASPYTREVLVEAASSSRTLSEALTKLGLDPRSSTRRYIQDRMRRLGVDASHFQREGRWTREVLAAAVAVCSNMNEVLRHLGVEVVGGQHTHISRRVRAFGIDTSHFTCTPRTRRRLKPEDLLTVQDPATARRIQSDRLRRAMTGAGRLERCASCGADPVWRGRPLPLEVDHVNGDWRDNRLENLRFLCPNCHSTTDTYRGRNRRQR